MKNLIINKSAFPFYTDYWQQYFSRLSGEQCKEVLRIVCQFNQSGEQEKHNDFGVDMVANSIITNVVRDAKKREKRIMTSQCNGKLGGRPAKGEKPKKNQPKPKETQWVIDFEEFWENYNPVKTKDGMVVGKGSKKLAKIAYEKALKNYTVDQIFDGTQAYLLECHTNNRLTCQASVMLNQEKFVVETYKTLNVK
jgi:hypothetical protein